MAYSDVILATSGLVHYYKLGEKTGTSIADSKGTETATAAGTFTLNVPGLLDNDITGGFDTSGGTTGTATVAAHTQIAGAGDFTLEGWIRGYTDTAVNRFFFGEGKSSDTNTVVYICTNAVFAGIPRLLVRNAAGTAADVTSSGAVVNDGSRHYLCLTGVRATNTLNLYVDDPVTAVATSSAYPTGTYGLNQFSIASLFRTTNGNFLPCVYGHLAEYNVALSQATRQAHVAAAKKGNPALFF